MTYRKFGSVALVVAGCLMSTVVAAEPVSYAVVPGESSVTFETSVVEQIIGGTTELSGTIVVDADHPGEGANARLVIAATTLASDNKKRDEHMHEKALHTAQYPTIVLTTTSVSTGASSMAEATPVTFDIAATLELHGQTQPMTFPVRVTRNGETLTVDGETSLQMTDYGIKQPRLLFLTVRDLTAIRFHIVAKHTAE